MAVLKSPETGVVNALAWTPAGGETMPVEAVAVPGSGAVDLTGRLGDVMKESARTALSYIRSKTDSLGIDTGFYKNHDLHIHVPEGATPKDGPSAGVALTCALVSALTGKPARQDVAMTGEVTLRGRVLPIGGVKEKLLAAHRWALARCFCRRKTPGTSRASGGRAQDAARGAGQGRGSGIKYVIKG
jgi:ATP-dependent Lon protease